MVRCDAFDGKAFFWYSYFYPKSSFGDIEGQLVVERVLSQYLFLICVSTFTYLPPHQKQIDAIGLCILLTVRGMFAAGGSRGCKD